MDNTKTNGAAELSDRRSTKHPTREEDGRHDGQDARKSSVVNDVASENATPSEQLRGNGKTNGASLPARPSITATVPANVAIPPDGGWGWVVVAASFCCNLVVDGIIYSFGMFLPVLAHHFGESNAKVSLIGSLLSGSYLIAGPFASGLANRFGFRWVTIGGAFIASFAFAISYFATSTEFLCITYGVLGGIGFGLIFVPAVITIGFYFEKWRALATGIAVCGSGIGTFLMAPISAWLIQRYTWKKALIIQAGFILNCAICGALFRPLQQMSVQVPVPDPQFQEELEHENDAKNKKKLPVLLKSKLLKDLKGRSESLLNVYEELGITVDDSPAAPDPKGYFSRNSRYPTASQILQLDVITDDERSNESIDAAQKPTATDDRLAELVVLSNRELSANAHAITQTEARERNKSTSSLNYTMSVTRLPTYNDILEEKEKFSFCPEAVRRTLATMLDVSLFKSYTFIVLAISGFITAMGMYTPFMFITDRAITFGIDKSEAVWFISVIGIANTVGRVGFGVLSSIPRMNAVLISNISLTVCGAVTLFSGAVQSAAYQFFYASIFGLTIACFSSLRTIIIVDLLGLEKLTNGFGLLLLFQGIAAVIGPPLAGHLKDVTKSYELPFYLSGGLIILSAVMCYPIEIINNWEKKRTKALANP